MRRDPALFWACVAVDESADGCWEWTRSFDTRGYAHLNWGGRTVRAHRVAYELSTGPIPVGAMLLHGCDNRKCVRPSHLRPGTHRDNMDDMVARGRRAEIGVADENGRAKLTWEQVRAIREDKRGKRVIAREYGISPAQAQRIRLGKQWVE